MERQFCINWSAIVEEANKKKNTKADAGATSRICVISLEALDDHFNAEGKNILKVFLANRDNIEHEVRRKYLAERREKDGSVLLKTEDIQ